MLYIFIPVLIIMGFYVYMSTADVNRETEAIKSKEIYRVGEKTQILNELIGVPIRHSFSLLMGPRNVSALGLGVSVKTQDIAAALTSLLYGNPDYVQAHWIDAKDNEMVRMDRSGRYIIRIPDGLLQDKSDRYYFYNSMDSALGSVYVSQMDLNIEYDNIEVPYNPMLRFSTHIPRRGSVDLGVFVINFSAGNLLDKIAVSIKDTHGASRYLINDKGCWLRGPTPEDARGFMLGHDRTIGTYSPKAWEQIQRPSHGQFQGVDGIWIWQEVAPHRENVSVRYQEKWKVVGFVP